MSPRGQPSPYVNWDLGAIWDEARRVNDEDVLAQAKQAMGARPMTEYQGDPEGFFELVFDVPRHTIDWELLTGYEAHEWDGTRNPLQRICQAMVDGENTAVLSATGTGKSFLAAMLIFWFLACWQDARVFTFAPIHDQLKLYIWAEIGKLLPKFQRFFPNAWKSEKLELFIDQHSPTRMSWAAFGRAVKLNAGETVSSRVAGMHAEHMLIIVEEGQGVASAVYEAIDNTCTAPHNFQLVLGNCDAKTDQLYAHYERPDFLGVRVSAYDHPNVALERFHERGDCVPGAVSLASVLRRRAIRGPDHWLYKSRVRGIPPDQSVNALFKFEHIDAAVARQRELVAEHDDGSLNANPRTLWIESLIRDGWKSALGVDPSQSETGDKAGITHMVGPHLVSATERPCPDSTALGMDVWLIAKAFEVLPDHIGVDPVGVGAGTVNYLRKETRELQKRRLPVSLPRLEPSSASIKRVAKEGEADEWEQDANLFKNLRAQMYWQLAVDFEFGRITMPEHPGLRKQLATMTYEPKGGQVVIMSKEEFRDEHGFSPNEMDAFVYVNWVRSREAPRVDPLPAPDQHHLGFKKTGGKVTPKTAEDVFNREHGVKKGGGRPGVGKWW